MWGPFEEMMEGGDKRQVGDDGGEEEPRGCAKCAVFDPFKGGDCGVVHQPVVQVRGQSLCSPSHGEDWSK